MFLRPVASVRLLLCATARASVWWLYCHVSNRGNARAEILQKVENYTAFATLLHAVTDRVPMRVLAHCLVPNHIDDGIAPASLSCLRD